MNWLQRLFSRNKGEPIQADWTPDPSIFNACLRIEHDLTNNPYVKYGINLEGLDDAQFSEAMNSAPASLVIYHQPLTPEMVKYARSGQFRELIKKRGEQ